jgi:hypothetical protein
LSGLHGFIVRQYELFSSKKKTSEEVLIGYVQERIARS